jgi:hypothetical protein
MALNQQVFRSLLLFITPVAEALPISMGWKTRGLHGWSALGRIESNPDHAACTESLTDLTYICSLLLLNYPYASGESQEVNSHSQSAHPTHFMKCGSSLPTSQQYEMKYSTINMASPHKLS